MAPPSVASGGTIMEYILFMLIVRVIVSVTLEDFSLEHACRDTVTFHPRITVRADVSLLQCAGNCLRSRFCLSFYYRNSNRTCILNAFRLPVGVNPTDATPSPGFNLYSSKYKVVDYPVTCGELQTYLNTATDGEYWIYPKSPTLLGNRAKVYCTRMNSATPRHYVTLVNANVGNYPAQARHGCRATTTLPAEAVPGVTTFTKIRITPKNMYVDRQEYVFATSTDKYNLYGQASDCYNEYVGPQICGPVGTFHMDTRQTGLIIDPQLGWSGFAWRPYPPQVTRSQGGAVIDLVCGGLCGGCAPNLSAARTMYLHYSPNDRLQDARAFPTDITSESHEQGTQITA